MELAVQVVSATTAIVALFLIWIQLRYQTKQMRFEALAHLHDELLDSDTQKALRFIYSSDPEQLANPRMEEELERIERVLSTYDLIGFKVRQGVLPEKATLETEWRILLSLWPQVMPFIQAERQRRGGVPYKVYLEALVKKAEDYKAKHYPEVAPAVYKRKFEPEYENSKPCVGVLIMDDDRLLLVQRSIDPFKGYWDIPGGFLEVGEHPEDGAVREVKEKTGLLISRPTEMLGILMDVYGYNGDSTLNICYVGEVIGGQIEASSDADNIEWFSLNALPANIAFDWAQDAISLLRCKDDVPS